MKLKNVLSLGFCLILVGFGSSVFGQGTTPPISVKTTTGSVTVSGDSVTITSGSDTISVTAGVVVINGTTYASVADAKGAVSDKIASELTKAISDAATTIGSGYSRLSGDNALQLIEKAAGAAAALDPKEATSIASSAVAATGNGSPIDATTNPAALVAAAVASSSPSIDPVAIVVAVSNTLNQNLNADSGGGPSIAFNVVNVASAVAKATGQTPSSLVSSAIQLLKVDPNIISLAGITAGTADVKASVAAVDSVVLTFVSTSVIVSPSHL